MSTLRIVHTADLHFGVENYGDMDSDTGLSTRLSDFILQGLFIFQDGPASEDASSELA